MDNNDVDYPFEFKCPITCDIMRKSSPNYSL